eukprot:363892_1
MSSLSIFIHIALYNFIHHLSSNSKPFCKTYKSLVSTTGHGDETSIKCDQNLNYPILISCGFSTKDTSETEFAGSYISDNICIARNAEGGSGVYAWARCCNFRQPVSCTATTDT